VFAHPRLFVVVVAVMSLLASFVVGGAFILVGQHIRLAVDSVNI